METNITTIIFESVNAPSGDNCQPWSFKIEGDSVSIYKKDQGNNNYLDFKSRGTLIAHGALIENIVIVANRYKYNTSISLFPDKNDTNLVSKISFNKDEAIVSDDVLYNVIQKRSTNRKVYKKQPLSDDHKKSIIESSNNSKVLTHFIETEEQKRALFTATTQMEKIALQNESLHSLFFGSIVWTKREEQSKKQGLFLKTMELPPPVEIFFKLLRYWPVAKALSFINFSEKVSQGNADSYQSSSGALIFSIKDLQPESFIETGRVMERVWLQATSCGVAVQPLAGVLYVYQRLAEEKNIDGVLTNDEAFLIEHSYARMSSLIGFSEGIITMILRVGYAEAPSAHSSKKSPEFL